MKYKVTDKHEYLKEGLIIEKSPSIFNYYFTKCRDNTPVFGPSEVEMFKDKGWIKEDSIFTNIISELANLAKLYKPQLKDTGTFREYIMKDIDLSKADKQEGITYTFHLDNPCIKETKKSKLINSIKERIEALEVELDLHNKRIKEGSYGFPNQLEKKIEIEKATLLLVEADLYPIKKKKGYDYWVKKLPTKILDNGIYYDIVFSKCKYKCDVSYRRRGYFDALYVETAKTIEKAMKKMHRTLKKEGIYNEIY